MDQGLIAFCLIFGIIIIFIILQMIGKKLCKHEWDIVDSEYVVDNLTFSTRKYIRYHLRCKKCGKMRCKNMR